MKKSTRRWISALALIVAAMTLTGGSCDDAVIRDEAVYRTELDFYHKTATTQADVLSAFVEEHCPCTPEGKFQSVKCHNAAEAVVVVRSRYDWHRAMSLYNAGLTDKRPPEIPPEIPPASSLCPE